MSERDVSLSRALGFWTLLIYGVGDILGAGIYALIGQISGLAGSWTWLAFLVAMLTATLTAMSYAELASRYPHSGGAAYFCHRAFASEIPALLVGWLVFCSGMVSMATLSRAFADYASAMLPQLPDALFVIAFLGLVSIVNFQGIRFSSSANIACTAVETSGLLIVIVAGLVFVSRGGVPEQSAPAEMAAEHTGLLSAAALAFYAFIGFEDLVNVAEEVHDPERVVPRALLGALMIAGMLYLAVTLASHAVLSPQLLGAAQAPLLDVIQHGLPEFPLAIFAVIPLFAVANSALVNSVMASRLLYGMSEQRLLPGWLGRVSPTHHTPATAVVVVFLISTGLALSGTLRWLAGTASVLLLGVFLVAHIALLIVKRREKDRDSEKNGFRVPAVIPCVGAVTVSGLAFYIQPDSARSAAVLLGIGLLIVGVNRWFGRTPEAV